MFVKAAIGNQYLFKRIVLNNFYFGGTFLKLVLYYVTWLKKREKYIESFARSIVFKVCDAWIFFFCLHCHSLSFNQYLLENLTLFSPCNLLKKMVYWNILVFLSFLFFISNHFMACRAHNSKFQSIVTFKI